MRTYLQGAVKKTALKHLLKAKYYEDIAKPVSQENRFYEPHPGLRSVGYSYAEVLAMLHRDLPSCKTTTSCLRWYVGRINSGAWDIGEDRLPRRRERSSHK